MEEKNQKGALHAFAESALSFLKILTETPV
jgi:hypothetical protein